MLKFKFDGKTYELGFNRATATTCEKHGLNIREITAKPLTNVPILVWGAFLQNHKDMTVDKAMEIYSHIGEKGEFVAQLITLYTDTYKDIFGSDNEGEAADGNFIAWSAE